HALLQGGARQAPRGSAGGQGVRHPGPVAAAGQLQAGAGGAEDPPARLPQLPALPEDRPQREGRHPLPPVRPRQPVRPHQHAALPQQRGEALAWPSRSWPPWSRRTRPGVRHGDIKTENVMVTSWNWVLLTDFASFKPTYLPEDNPADFNYFFDTSRRRTCYIAPERFVDGSMFASESDQSTPLVDLSSSNQRSRGELRQAMDIFSAGCVIAELFTEGVPLFDLSQLLAYRRGLFQTEQVLLKIEDRSVRDLVAQMVQREPENALTAEEHLKQQRGRAFPDIFYTFLQPYIAQFAKDTFQSADERVLVIRKDLDNILHNLR
ncbi:unnamed protein product, partial [Tetraodon nigroviridis]